MLVCIRELVHIKCLMSCIIFLHRHCQLVVLGNLVSLIKGSDMERVFQFCALLPSTRTQLTIISLVILSTGVHLHPLCPSSVFSLPPSLSFSCSIKRLPKITFCVLVNRDLLILLLGTNKFRSYFREMQLIVLSLL